MKSSKDKKRSSYCGRTPFRYSDLYYRWEQAVKAGREHEAGRLGREHSQRFLGNAPQADRRVMQKGVWAA